GISKDPVYKIRDNLAIWVAPYAPYTLKIGKPRKLRKAQVKVRASIQAFSIVLLEYLNEFPTTYLNEMQDFCYNKYNAVIFLQAIHDTLARTN
ncbi:hypothetical protein K469DRAFT_609712, partial [Zopfia rhizophila CBS 207.26]